MRGFLIILLFSNLLFANANFWTQLNDATIRLFDSEFKDSNKTVDNSLLKSKNKESIKSTTEKRLNFYKNIVKVIKEEPLDLKDESIDFYNEKKSIERIYELESMKTHKVALENVKINIELLNLELHKAVYFFLKRTSEDFNDLNLAKIKYNIDCQRVYISYFEQDMEMFKEDIELFKQSKRKKIENSLLQIKEAIRKLNITYNMYKSFIDYLYKNQDIIFVEKSVIKKLALDKSIDIVNKISNEISFIAQVNSYLAYIHTDIGRLSIFFLVIGFFWMLKYVNSHSFIPYLKKKLDTPEVDGYDIVLANFDNIKRPLTYIVRIFGLDLAVDVLTYPKESPPWVDHTFSLIYIINIAWLLIVLIDVIVAILMETRHKKNKEEIRKELINLVIKVLKVLIFIVALLIFLKNVGFDITALLTSLGIGGLAVALAAKDTIANFFSSLKIIFEESFSQGDWIKSGDVEGSVVELGFGSTKVRTFDNALISVPNSVLANQSVKNWSKRVVGRRIRMSIGVTYNSKREDLKKAVKEIKEMLEEHPAIATDKKTATKTKKSRLIKVEDKYGIKKTLLVYFDSFSASSMDILIYAFTKTVAWAEWLEAKEDILYKIWEILEKNNLEFAFPSQTIYFDKENSDILKLTDEDK